MLTLDDGYGYATVEVKGSDGATRTVRLDLWEANNAFVSLFNAHADAVVQGQAWCDWLAGKGLPGLSHGAAFRLQDHIAEQITTLKKSDRTPDSSVPPESPVSTVSTASG